VANTLLTPTAVTRKALMVLHQKLTFVGSINRQYDDSFAKEGAKIGSQLKIRLPNQFTVGSSPVITPQDTTEVSTTLTVSSQKNVPLKFTSQDLAMSLDDFSERILDPAMSVLAANIEADALTMALDVSNQVNNQGSAATFNKALQARKQLVDNLAPVNDRMVVLNTQDNVDLVDALKGLFNQQATIGKQNREGYLGRTAGFDWTENTLLPTFTPGARNGAYTTDTTVGGQMPLSATPLAAITVATGAGAMAKGDVFTIANVFRVHPETRASTGVLQQFVVTTAYAGGGGSVSISPSIVLAGAYQNVVIPATSATAAMTFAGTASTAHGISLAYQKDAFTFATADLFLPKGLHFAAREQFDGISMRILEDFDVTNDTLICRCDVLYGFKTIRAQLASRMANN
jgi:hypothetical protein